MDLIWIFEVVLEQRSMHVYNFELPELPSLSRSFDRKKLHCAHPTCSLLTACLPLKLAQWSALKI